MLLIETAPHTKRNERAAREMDATAMLDTMGKRLNLLRNEMGIEQREVVRRMEQHGVKIGTSHYSKIERDVTKPSIDVLVALARVLESTPSYLSLFDDQPYPITEKDDDLYISETANEIAHVADRLTESNRQLVLEVAKRLQDAESTGRERDRLQREFFAFVDDNLQYLPQNKQDEIKSIIARFES